jgi:hypothetical protein
VSRLVIALSSALALAACQGPSVIKGTNKGELKLSVEGDSREPALELTYDVGAVPVGQRREFVVRGTNTGVDAMRVLGVSLGSGGNGSFFVRDTMRTLEPGQSVSVTVTFAPAATGAQRTTVTFSHDADAQLPVLTVTGTGT